MCKFSDTDSKVCVKGFPRSANLKGTPFNVIDQLPQEVHQRRNALIPEMMKASFEGKRAYLVRDKLFVNREYTPGSG